MARLKRREEQQMRVPRIKETGEGFDHSMSRVVDRRMKEIAWDDLCTARRLQLAPVTASSS